MATTHKKKSSSSSSSKKSSKKKTEPAGLVPLKPENYPAEISFRIRAYNSEVVEINELRKKDPKLAQARGEVMKIKKESFDAYASMMASIAGNEANKIRKTVGEQGWYKGMPQIAFVASKGLPDDIETTRTREGNHLKLIYRAAGTYYFEKGRLRSFDKKG